MPPQMICCLDTRNSSSKYSLPGALSQAIIFFPYLAAHFPPVRPTGPIAVETPAESLRACEALPPHHRVDQLLQDQKNYLAVYAYTPCSRYCRLLARPCAHLLLCPLWTRARRAGCDKLVPHRVSHPSALPRLRRLRHIYPAVAHRGEACRDLFGAHRWT